MYYYYHSILYIYIYIYNIYMTIDMFLKEFTKAVIVM